MVGRPGGLEALGRDALSGGVNNFSTRGRGAAPAFLSRRGYGFTRLCASRAVRPMSGVAQCVTCGRLYSDGGVAECPRCRVRGPGHGAGCQCDECRRLCHCEICTASWHAGRARIARETRAPIVRTGCRGGTCLCHVPNWDGTPCAGCGCKRVVDAPVTFARWRVIDEHGVTVASFDDRCDAEDAAGALVAGRVLDGRARVPCPVPGCGCPTWCPTCPRCHDV